MGEVCMSNLGINPNFNYAQRAKKWVFDKMPSLEFKNPGIIRSIKWIGQNISSPQNRVILGATALMSQPFIDLHNRNVNEETRKVSAARTVAKIIAGTTTGFLVRHYCIKAVNAFSKDPAEAENFLQSIFFPKGIAKTSVKGMIKYRKALGTYASLAVMLFTNFAIDAPLTKFLTNIFVKEMINRNKIKTNPNIITPPKQDTSTPKQEIKNENILFYQRPKMDKFINRKEDKKC